jgi:RND family efflux transporter MFP subunit
MIRATTQRFWFVFCFPALVAVGCGEKTPPTPPPPAVTVALPTRAAVADFREYTGRIEAVETEEVRARVKGYLEKVHFQEGAEVKKGKLLYEIDPRTFETDVAKATAEVARWETQVGLATDEVERALRVRGKGISEEEYQQRLAARNAAQANLQQAKAALEGAKLELGFTRIEAKIDGRIGRTLVTEGNLVGFNQPTLLTTIVRLDPVYVYFEDTESGLAMYERQVSALGVANLAAAKMPVKVELPWENGYPHEGYLDFRDNRIDPGTGTVLLRAVLGNARRVLTPGQFVRVRVELGQPKERLLVPAQALGRDQIGKFLLVVQADNTVAQRPVTTGPMHGSEVVIERGVSANERVIINGLQRARPGAVVAARKSE